jgi:hypothetical protein
LIDLGLVRDCNIGARKRRKSLIEALRHRHHGCRRRRSHHCELPTRQHNHPGYPPWLLAPMLLPITNGSYAAPVP